LLPKSLRLGAQIALAWSLCLRVVRVGNAAWCCDAGESSGVAAPRRQSQKITKPFEPCPWHWSGGAVPHPISGSSEHPSPNACSHAVEEPPHDVSPDRQSQPPPQACGVAAAAGRVVTSPAAPKASTAKLWQIRRRVIGRFPQDGLSSGARARLGKNASRSGRAEVARSSDQF